MNRTLRVNFGAFATVGTLLACSGRFVPVDEPTPSTSIESLDASIPSPLPKEGATDAATPQLEIDGARATNMMKCLQSCRLPMQPLHGFQILDCGGTA
jgi:hypothetical protein